MVFSALSEVYESFMDARADPRTKDWFLMENPVKLLAIILAYLYFCTNYGPRYMKHRQPFELKRVMFVYNSVNVVLSIWIMYEAMQSGWWRDYSFRCQPMNYRSTQKPLRMARVCWTVFISKLIDLLDTVFFILRKKDSQVTHLHIYHHTIMPVCCWITCRFLPGGHVTFGIPINSLIHAVMYSYYLLSSLGPQYQKYLWWKKYLTLMQLIQFVVVIIHQSQLFIFECNYPKTISVIQIVNGTYFFYLFYSFYKSSYTSRETKTTKIEH